MSRKIAPCAIAFDMDGVFWKLPHIFSYSKRTLNKVIANNIPFVFLTNGGGEPEPRRLKTFNKRLQMEFNDVSQLILSHTPLKQYLYPKYENELILLAGSRDNYEVGLHYGLKRCISAGEVLSHHPYLWPFASMHKNLPLNEDRKQNKDIIDFDARNAAAIAVIDDGDCWGSETQVIVDCLMYASAKDGKEHIPIHFVNQDKSWTTSYPYPRFAQGIYAGIINYAYEQMSGKKLSNVVQVGKPTLITYEYAKLMLEEQAIKCGFSDGIIEEYYMIGDNPAADIAGAHNIGWNSILLKTGVYQEGKDANNPTHIVETVENAVDWICANHGLNRN